MDAFITIYVAQLLMILTALLWNVVVWATGKDNYVTTYARNDGRIGYSILVFQQFMTIMLAFHFYY